MKKWPPQPQTQQKPRQHPSQSRGPNVLQPKSAVPTQVKKATQAPPVYRPQPVPRVLQLKKAGAQKPLAAPTPYRPEPNKIVQPKMIIQMKRRRSRPYKLRGDETPEKKKEIEARIERQKERQEAGKAKALKQSEHAAAKRTQRAANQQQATFLMGATEKLFADTKKKNKKLMEVQAGIIGDKMFLASNYSKGADDAMDKAMAKSYSYTHGETTYEYTGKETLTPRSGTLHAEQQILLDLARTLRNPNLENPSHVTVIGTKRPCSTCRRVLLAFNRALRRHYPEIRLHFIDKTGQDTGVTALNLMTEKSTTDTQFNAFVDTYTALLETYERYKAGRLIGEEGTSSVRTPLKPTLEDLT